MFILFGGGISWISKRWDLVSFSTMEVEYMTATYTSIKSLMDIEIVFGYWVCTTRCKVRL